MQPVYSWNPDIVAWQNGIDQFPEANFLQSYQWGEFHQELGKKILRLQVIQGQSVRAQVTGIIESARRGTYLAIAGGPLVDWTDTALVLELFAALKQKAQEYGCSFIRFRPQVTAEVVSQTVLDNLRAVKAPMHLTADLTLQLDITQPDDELLKAMRKNTRAAVRKATALGITTTVSEDPAEIDAFYEEEKKVAQRHGFVPFSLAFLKTQFRLFAQDGSAALVHAHSEDGSLLASAFVLFYNQEAVYHYGVSTEKNASLPGSYACQWRAIAEARARGCTRYNFWGIAPKEQTQHRFAGVSLFKRGFGGTEVEYLEAQDIPLSVWYWVTYVFEYSRKKYRRL